MSNYYKKTMSLAGMDFSNHSVDDLRGLVRKILEAKIHGICRSPYVEGDRSRYPDRWSANPGTTGFHTTVCSLGALLLLKEGKN